MIKWLVRFVRDEAGQDLVEYAFLLVFISVVTAVALNFLGISLNTLYQAIASNLPTTAPVIPAPGS